MKNKSLTLSGLTIAVLAALYIILPIYFSFELSSVLPSFTGSRIIVIVSIFIIALTFHRIIIPGVKQMKVIYLYIIVITLVNVIHLSDSSLYSVKAIFSLVIENLILVCIMCTLLTKREKIEMFIKIMVITSGIVAVLAIIEFLTGYNVFELLTTTSRIVYRASYIRLGMMRAETSFGHPVYYGVYCSCMIPFSLYLYESTMKKKFLFIALLNIIGTIVSGSRGQMVACFVTCFLIYLSKKGSIKRKYSIAILGVLIMGILAIFFIPTIFSYVVENIKSILNIVGFNFSISADYGINAGGVDSRIVQLSGLRWLFEKNSFLFGLGSLAANRGLVSYYWASSGWQTVTSIDVGYVGWFLEYGLIGAIANLILFLSFLRDSIKRANDKILSNLYNPIKWFFICYLLNLMSSTGIDKLLWIVIGLMISIERVNKMEMIQKIK